MPNYQDGKIYKIHSYKTNKIYIGSTTQPLCKRLSDHKTKFKRGNGGTMSKKILIYDDAMITLIETYSCNDKNELEKRERYHIENNNCINKIIPTRTKKEYDIANKDYQIQYRINRIEIRKQYLIENVDKINQYVKQYKIDNKDKIKQYQKQYDKQYYNNNKDKIKQNSIQKYINNKEHIKDQVKKYRLDNIDKIKIYQKQYGKYRNSHFGIICKSYGIFH